MNKVCLTIAALALLLVTDSASAKRRKRHRTRRSYDICRSVYYTPSVYPVASWPMMPVSYPVVYPGYVAPVYNVYPVTAPVAPFNPMVSPYTSVNFHFGF